MTVLAKSTPASRLATPHIKVFANQDAAETWYGPRLFRTTEVPSMTHRQQASQVEREARRFPYGQRRLALTAQPPRLSHCTALAGFSGASGEHSWRCLLPS
jgi:hypothetical protein